MFNIYNRRYTGSKLKLADWIIGLVCEHCKGDSFFEIFAGTSVVSSRIAPKMKTIILNDTLEANRVIYEAFYGRGDYDLKRLITYRDELSNIIAQTTDGYFATNYGDRYFSRNDCRKIESVRNRIEEIRPVISSKEYSILLASLIYSMDRCANTVGHFDAYIHSDSIADKFSFDIIEPFNCPNTTFEIFDEDANALANRVTADIVYVDPPYNSRQYCQFYHIYETIVRWDNPELFGTALKPKGSHLSDYCRSKAPDVFADLISKLNCHYIVVSYNNTYESKSGSSRNKITLAQIEQTLQSRGEVKVFSKAHQYFNAGKTDFQDHKEMLFIVRITK
jgi:adenine-specific DNA-methyltransferase